MTEQEKQARMLELKERATEYASDKSIEATLKKKIENNNTSIKALFEMLGEDAITLDNGVTVCYGITRKESLDEEKLIGVLKTHAPDTECIKTKEYVDTDVLENELYHEKFSEDAMKAMDECRVVKEVPTLTIKKAKKGK